MLLTQLEYFVALATEQHFGRAARACQVSPSTLSEAIHKLEVELGVPLVRRGRTFEGLTLEGSAALVRARRITADARAMQAELAQARGQIVGDVRIGVIPSATEIAASVAVALGRAEPGIRVSLLTGLTSEEIVRSVRSHELDVGLIHPDGADGQDLQLLPVGEVDSVVVAGPGVLPEGLDAVRADELADLPLALLGPRMRARQILDAAVQEAGMPALVRLADRPVSALTRAVEQVAVLACGRRGVMFRHGLDAPPGDGDTMVERVTPAEPSRATERPGS